MGAELSSRMGCQQRWLAHGQACLKVNDVERLGRKKQLVVVGSWYFPWLHWGGHMVLLACRLHM